MASVRVCYQWMTDNGKDLVYQVQDDYLFERMAVFEVIDMYFQVTREHNTEPLISPYNDPYYWAVLYKGKSTPRLIVPGKHRYWIQLYDLSCSFLTSSNQFKQHWDLYEKFLDMPPTGVNGNLENLTLNHMLVKRGVLGLVPLTSIALHIQSDAEKDPYVDWKPLWNNFEKDIL